MAQQFEGIDILVSELLHDGLQELELAAEESAAPTDCPHVQDVVCYVQVGVRLLLGYRRNGFAQSIEVFSRY